jgi:hypothetical protein
MPLREFIAQAITEKLGDGAKHAGKPWLECAGIAAHLHEETMRIQRIIEDEFGH